MDSVSTITEWYAPHRFVKEGSGGGPNAPAMANEWTVEARSGGTMPGARGAQPLRRDR